MISRAVISVLITFCLFNGISAHDHNSDYSVKNNLSCYSCMYVEGKENSTNRGCESAKPPREYQTTECFGFGNIKAASEIRHNANLSQHYDGPHIVHCVTVSGNTDTGAKVIFRGCDYRNDTLKDKTCYDDSDFPSFGIGIVRNVQKCYCNKNACNSSSLIVVSYITMLIGTLMAIVGVSTV